MLTYVLEVFFEFLALGIGKEIQEAAGSFVFVMLLLPCLLSYNIPCLPKHSHELLNVDIYLVSFLGAEIVVLISKISSYFSHTASMLERDPGNKQDNYYIKLQVLSVQRRKIKQSKDVGWLVE